MSKKRILIVDDEESILTVLKNSLKKFDDYEVVTVADGFAALDQLLAHSFDLVVTDYNMAQMDGLELMEAIRYAQPDAQLVMITAYGTNAVEAEAKRLQVFRYMTKPLEIETFRQVVKEAIGQEGSQRGPIILSLSDQQYQDVSRLLETLRMEVSAHCIFLTDANGHIMARTGHTEGLAIENIASLLGGGIATMIEAGRTMDGGTKAINLAYREGEQEDLYALNIGKNLLLILVINRGPYSSRLGSVWYHARQAVVTLQKKLQNVENSRSSPVFEEALGQAFDAELDKLLSGDELF